MTDHDPVSPAFDLADLQAALAVADAAGMIYVVSTGHENFEEVLEIAPPGTSPNEDSRYWEPDWLLSRKPAAAGAAVEASRAAGGYFEAASLADAVRSIAADRATWMIPARRRGRGSRG